MPEKTESTASAKPLTRADLAKLWCDCKTEAEQRALVKQHPDLAEIFSQARTLLH